MSNVARYEELDNAIDLLMADAAMEGQHPDAEINGCLEMASMLRELPSAKYKARLAAELQFAAIAPRSGIRPTHHLATARNEYHPMLLEQQSDAFRMRGSNFVASFVVHAAGFALIAWSGFWMAQQHLFNHSQSVMIADTTEYTLPVAPDASHGGGGGGYGDKLQASTGTPPKFLREQLAPPAIVVRNEDAKLTVQPTVVGPPKVDLSHGQLGDPLSALVTPSNGPGFGGGIGTGSGGGIGMGKGPGVGAGEGGGIGGGVYRVGGGVTAPRVISNPDPEYSEEARKAKFQGTVVLWLVIGTDGRTRNVQVARSLGMGLDQKAIEAVKKWRFEPGRKDGVAVPVEINVEVSFRLY